MAKRGCVGEFFPEREQWDTYVERLQNYFVANDIGAEAKKRAILLSICGVTTYQFIRNLSTPTKPSDLSYEDLVKLVREHFHPRRSEIVQHFHFNSRVRQSNETIAAFVAELRKLSEFCNFRDKLDEMLRDRIVCGINHLAMQRRLLSETDLTLAKTLEVAQGLEAAEKSSKVMQEVEQKPLVTVQRIQQQKTKPIQNCYRCGGQHIAQTCFFRDKECHICHKRGHISKMCRSGRQQQCSKQRTRKPHMQTHHVEDNYATRSDEEDTHRLLRLTDSRAKPI